MGVTNKRGLDWVVGFIDYSFTITHYHNQLQELPANLQPNPSSWTAEDSLHAHSDSILFCTTYIVSRRIHRKHVRCLALDVICCWLRICCGLLYGVVP
jgi:hypothetical protein